ncbi:hypothetical protein C1H69_19580 [Billgrantia endophytica]|uniref:DUF3018 domain-containing protein n=1 Tax=Billgrantia endophytica TaxID=2033802 RepID=A0A2N7TXJ0_9GAMM|nr:hypothetical protein C1H69_19580 [Halomonas endophytica]
MSSTVNMMAARESRPIPGTFTRPIQIWVPDVRSAAFQAEAHRQSQAVATSRDAAGDQAFIDSLSEWDDSPWKSDE